MRALRYDIPEELLLMKLLPLALTLLLAGLIFGAFLAVPPPEPAGDIAEYFGITESVLRHSSINLTPQDQTALSQTLHPEYFSNPGYYIPGTDGNRYPVHFIGYSLLLTPLRWILQQAGIPELHIFSLANTLLLFGAITYILLRFLRQPSRQLLFVTLTITSPLIFFLWWPGPDIFSLSFLLISLFWLYEGGIFPAAALTAIASWQAQPMIVITASMLLYGATHTTNAYRKKILIPTAIILCLAALPYLYNFILLRTLTPWTILKDGWTTMNGFGLHNMSIQKLFEQFFDLNMGVFWYAPLLVSAGIIRIAARIRHDAKIRWLALTGIAVLFAYQTNPAWHYGTSGFGPSRHTLVMIPFLIAAIVWHAKPKALWTGFMVLLFVSQVAFLSLNNYIFPVFSNTLVHSPIARFVLDRWPALYTPTPEIFSDRTNHTDLDHPSSAIYQVNGTCKKAYVLGRDIDMVIATCGSFPESVRASILNPDTDGFYVTYD